MLNLFVQEPRQNTSKRTTEDWFADDDDGNKVPVVTTPKSARVVADADFKNYDEFYEDVEMGKVGENFHDILNDWSIKKNVIEQQCKVFSIIFMVIVLILILSLTVIAIIIVIALSLSLPLLL